MPEQLSGPAHGSAHGSAVRPAGPVRAPGASERLAALGALAGQIAAVVLVAVEVALNILAVLGAAAALLICVTSGWYMVSRRGAIRVAALVVIAAGAALLIVALIYAHFSVLRVALAVVLAAASVLAARYALRRTPRALGTAATRLPAGPTGHHPVLIMNLKSGGGKAERFGLADECRRRGIEPIVLRPGDDLAQLAEDAISRGADVIGMAGGDGSQAMVATVAARRGVPHVCVPAGTRNHFALDLGLNRDDVVGALDAFTDGVDRRIDLASVNGRIFVNNASLGLYASIVESPEYRDAKLRTAATVLPDLLGPDAVPLDLRFHGPDGTSYPTAELILVSNNPYQLDSLGGLGTREHLDSGVLGVVALRLRGPVDIRRFAALEAAGQVRRFGGWLEWTTLVFEVSSGGPVSVGVDGESLQLDPPLIFESRPGALRVRLPRHAVGLSPAARTVRVLSGSTVADLGRVLSRSAGTAQSRS